MTIEVVCHRRHRRHFQRRRSVAWCHSGGRIPSSCIPPVSVHSCASSASWPTPPRNPPVNSGWLLGRFWTASGSPTWSIHPRTMRSWTDHRSGTAPGRSRASRWTRGARSYTKTVWQEPRQIRPGNQDLKKYLRWCYFKEKKHDENFEDRENSWDMNNSWTADRCADI